MDSARLPPLMSRSTLMRLVQAGYERCLVAPAVAVAVAVLSWSAHATEPSFDLTARYILEIVKAFRTAYVLNVVEHAKESGVRPSEDWQEGFALYSSSSAIREVGRRSGLAL